MHVVVDMALCEANGVCLGIVPEVFDLDDNDELQVLLDHPGDEFRDRVHEAVRQCPRQAISVEGAD